MSTMKRIVCLVVAASLWSAGTTESADQRRRPMAPSLKVGQKAPSIKLEYLNKDKEKDFDLKAFAGKKPVVLVFGSYT